VVITMIGRKVQAQPGLRQHRVSAVDIRDVSTHHGFPVTAPARTLIDGAATSLPLDRLLNQPRALALVTDAEIHAAMDRCPGRKGVRALRALLETEQDTGFTRSKAERILKRLVKEAELERPIFNTRVMGVEVDAYWPRLQIVIEVDGYDAHGHWAAFQRDRAKANKLVAAGLAVLRFTWHQLTQKAARGPRRDRPDDVCAQLTQNRVWKRCRFSSHPRAQEGEQMGDSIVVGTDGSETAKQAVSEAVRLAKALAAPVHVVSAYQPSHARVSGAPEGAAKVWQPLPDDEVERILSEAAAGIRLAGLEATSHAIRKDPADALLSVADEVGASMIVVGSKGMHGARRLALGNVPNKVSHHARCNVLIVATDGQG
jgi:nucleotide-binding universal stress UspA family protein/very-short-patch-repair endonuclease